MIGHKTSLNKFKNIEIILSIFSDHKGLKLETDLKEKTQNTQTHGDWIAGIKEWKDQEGDQGRNQKVSGNKCKWTHNSPKLMGHSKGSPEMEVHSDTGLSKKKK